MSDLQLAAIFPYIVFGSIALTLWAAGFIVRVTDDDDDDRDGGSLIPAYAKNR